MSKTELEIRSRRREEADSAATLATSVSPPRRLQCAKLWLVCFLSGLALITRADSQQLYLQALTNFETAQMGADQFRKVFTIDQTAKGCGTAGDQ